MTMKLLSIAALSLMLAGGVAMAQTEGGADASGAKGDSSSNADGGSKYLTDPAKMGAFYTDDTMTTMRSADEMKAAWAAMSAEDQTAMKTECESSDSIKYKDFCGAIGTM